MRIEPLQPPSAYLGAKNPINKPASSENTCPVKSILPDPESPQPKPLPCHSKQNEILSSAINEMKQLPSVINMLKAVNLSPQAQNILEEAIANAALQFGNVKDFFASGHEKPKSPL